MLNVSGAFLTNPIPILTSFEVDAKRNVVAQALPSAQNDYKYIYYKNLGFFIAFAFVMEMLLPDYLAHLLW